MRGKIIDQRAALGQARLYLLVEQELLIVEPEKGVVVTLLEEGQRVSLPGELRLGDLGPVRVQSEMCPTRCPQSGRGSSHIRAS
ncbi:MAG: hypothetical protein ACR2KD_01095 [Thermoleophilaceae bacterium]